MDMVSGRLADLYDCHPQGGVEIPNREPESFILP